MTMRIVCPEGHPVALSPSRLGKLTFCPCCFTSFWATLGVSAARQARKEDGRARRAADDGDDDDDEAPQKKSKAKSAAKDEDDEILDLGDDAIQDDAIQAGEKPRIKKAAKKADAKKDEEEIVDLGDDAIQEGDKPRIKKKPAKKEDEEEDEDDEPRARKGGRKRDRDEEEEEEDEDEEKEEVDPFADDPIVWTKRKRQLKVAANAMLIYQVSFWIMFAMYILDVVAGLCQVIALFGVGLFELLVLILFAFILLPSVGITFLSLLVSWIMCFWAPPRAQLRAPLITAILFLMLPVLFLLIFLILNLTEVFRNDVITSRFGELILMACGLSMLISFFYGLEVVRRLAFFMKNVSLSNQPITLGWFIIGGTVLRMITALIFVFLVKAYQGIPIGFFTALLLGIPIYVSWSLFFFILRSILDLIVVINKLRAEIDKYIRYS